MYLCINICMYTYIYIYIYQAPDSGRGAPKTSARRAVKQTDRSQTCFIICLFVDLFVFDCMVYVKTNKKPTDPRRKLTGQKESQTGSL